MDPEEWATEITEKGYDYLLLQDRLGCFNDKYQSMFDDGLEGMTDYTLYDVIEENGTVRFVQAKGR